MYEIAKAIAIPLRHIPEQYSLNTMRFDPTQNSPPSLWKMRLNKRVGSPFNPRGSAPSTPFTPFDPRK